VPKSSDSSSSRSRSRSICKEKRKSKKKKKKLKKSLEEGSCSIGARSKGAKKKKKGKSKHKSKKEKKSKVELVGEEAEKRSRMAPMTKEEWEKQQSQVRREFDEDTGRMRLVKGSGEILEECVSKERMLQINKQATQADGHSFQRQLKTQT